MVSIDLNHKQNDVKQVKNITTCVYDTNILEKTIFLSMDYRNSELLNMNIKPTETIVITPTNNYTSTPVIEATPIITPSPQPTVSPTPKETIVEPEPQYISRGYSISNLASDFKSYMDYRKITNTSSKQYQMQKIAYTDSNGLRKIDEYYCVAMGTYYGNLGDKFYVETDEGACWKIILSDIKSDLHTDSTHRYTLSNGCMMEFIVDTDVLDKSIRLSGTVNGLGFQGNISYIKKIS